MSQSQFHQRWRSKILPMIRIPFWGKGLNEHYELCFPIIYGPRYGKMQLLWPMVFNYRKEDALSIGILSAIRRFGDRFGQGFWIKFGLKISYNNWTILAKNNNIPASYKNCALIMLLFISSKTDSYCQKWTGLNFSNQKPGLNISGR